MLLRIHFVRYDNLNRLHRVFQSGPNGAVAMKIVYFGWDGLDRLTYMDRREYVDGLGWRNPLNDIYTHDKDSRLTALQHKKYTTRLSSYTWTYDRASRPTQFTSFLDGTVNYTYDTTSQLLTADYNYQTDETYSYDANGNRTMTGYDTGDNNQLTTDGTYTYTYDAEGNRTAKFVDEDSSGTLTTGDTGITKYEWDHRNRLVKAGLAATLYTLPQDAQREFLPS